MSEFDPIESLIYHEAHLLDNKEFDEWLAMLTEDILYWAPLKRGQTEEEVYNSLFYEDLLMLRIRIERLRSTRVFSQEPESYCQHVLQKPQIWQHSTDKYASKTPFLYVEARGDEQFVLSGVAHHEFVETGEGVPKIRRKRIELLNRNSALPSIQMLI